MDSHGLTDGRIFEKTIFENPPPRLKSIKKGAGKNARAISLGRTESFPEFRVDRLKMSAWGEWAQSFRDAYKALLSFVGVTQKEMLGSPHWGDTAGNMPVVNFTKKYRFDRR